jgi:hypothetical protein
MRVYVKSHLKITWKLKVFEMIRKLKYEFWDVLDLNMEFHQNLSKLDAKIEMLVMYAKQWFSRAKMKFWSEILKFGAQMH